MKLYGISTCDSVRKARKFFKENEIDLEFIDFKKTSVDCKKVDEWLEQIEMDILFNSRGTKYRILKLKELNLDASGKREWLCRENMLFKRPIIEYKGQVIVGFDEEKYEKIFIK
ncbi:arsenate reductase family protein [Sulfurimonas sp.]|uniref:arsenate reductase family protein n=1 Tax=Sulfurimonas sp. TaxID=2022749 RepID=UPI002AB083C3|nr:arsenate reductase family protein [Sulfurimonas sp.]